MRSQGDIYGFLTHSFDPTSVTVARGGSVTWSNSSGQVHNVTFAAVAGAPSNIGDHLAGSTSRPFSTAGTFSYSCTNHPEMQAQVVVQ